jgi:hypothetical protein
MRNIAIFAGGSITMGLGLELEMRPKYNDHEWLKKNGLKQPLPRDEEDKVYWRKYRYSKIVSDSLGLVEFNIHDKHEYQIGGNAMDTLWYLNRDVEKFSGLMKNVKYIFLEVGFIRWWDKNIHGINNDNRFPSTVDEIVKFVSDPGNDFEVSSVALEWLSKLDENVFWEESFNRFKILKELNPEIKFIIIPWSVNRDNILLTKTIDGLLKDDMVKFGEFNCMMNFINEKKLNVGDVAKVFNGDYEYTYKDLHPCVEGHIQIADYILKHIENENN